ncbi:hypothetical protein MKK64_02085 [Methylobacterium sp. E-025]|uniref:hypothetical protein n=1 Tax=Methylobacterium sp. E-025 TaxID=2836561 RepID=UPI001FBA207E|nr:hypothetical protein [Methylobacterium sp. E-025]MCJ2110008.1 hypothetical protein [Methylobacterium sp. E-025]
MADLSNGPDNLAEMNLPPCFRAFLIDAAGNIARLVSLVANDDLEASDLAQAMAAGHAVDLWDGVRFIGHIDMLSDAY